MRDGLMEVLDDLMVDAHGKHSRQVSRNRVNDIYGDRPTLQADEPQYHLLPPQEGS
jgi:hypothetical protein